MKYNYLEIHGKENSGDIMDSKPSLFIVMIVASQSPESYVQVKYCSQY